MKERYLSKTPFLTFVYISKCNINLPGYFGNSKKRFLWTGLMHTVSCIGFRQALTFQTFKKIYMSWFSMMPNIMDISKDKKVYIGHYWLLGEKWVQCGSLVVLWCTVLGLRSVDTTRMWVTSIIYGIAWYFILCTTSRGPRPLPRCYLYVGHLDHFLHHCELFTTYHLLYHL